MDQGHYPYFPGEVINGYTLIKQLGEGTFGRVIEAKQAGRYYAIKIIRAVERYIRAANVTTHLILFRIIKFKIEVGILEAIRGNTNLV